MNGDLILRALREENSWDLFFLALHGREEREFLEGKLDAHLKNVQPPSVDRRVNRRKQEGMEPPEEIKISPAIYRGRFLFLFISIVLSFAVRPFLEGSLEAFVLSGIFFSFILLACIYSVSETRGAFLFAPSRKGG